MTQQKSTSSTQGKQLRLPHFFKTIRLRNHNRAGDAVSFSYEIDLNNLIAVEPMANNDGNLRIDHPVQRSFIERTTTTTTTTKTITTTTTTTRVPHPGNLPAPGSSKENPIVIDEDDAIAHQVVTRDCVVQYNKRDYL
ncbi:hypothetical protein BDN72DRAFT_866274 [Pluteus cervinus]|uniref:Uncharacterized protein n=1 Tax=Pluteus cervinus TaxID=181527 RepID=A0ACD2ZX77_9AGAR|nr:hypothetical protein BDN72DRAFT_866274 [Pluteus cervinus]